MFAKCLLPAAALLLTAGTAAAQDQGGIGFPAGGISPANMAQAFAQPARMPVFANPVKRGAPPGALVTNPNVSRKSVHEQAITKIRGDAGLLAGFSKGQALAPSRQPPVQMAPPITFIDAPFIVNNFDSNLNFAFGDGNVSAQAAVQTSGEVAPAPVAEAPAPQPAAPVAAAPAFQPAAPAQKVAQPKTAPQRPALPTLPAVPSLPTVPSGPKPDALMTNLGPLPHLPYALEHGGVQFNNVNSVVNMATGTGNVAVQRARIVQK